MQNVFLSLAINDSVSDSVSKPWFPESFKVKEGLLCNATAEKVHAETKLSISLVKYGILIY